MQGQWLIHYSCVCFISRRYSMVKKKNVNRKYKDTIFRMLFGNDRNELLKLYNAVNDSDYRNPDDLTINTLEEALFVSMRNDVSFVFQDDLNLYEHQSSLCPNLPLRDLFYVADLLHDMTVDMNIYGSKLLKIPTPRFIVFYNGEDDPDEDEYRLSELFVKKEDHPQLELTVKIININDGQDNKVLRSCKTLQEYAKFVAMVRMNRKTMEIEDAVNTAVDDCIRLGILKDFLNMNRSKVIKTSLYEYNEEKQRKFDREEGREEERANTERERQRADAAEARANTAEQRANEEKRRADAAEARIKELEAQLKNR